MAIVNLSSPPNSSSHDRIASSKHLSVVVSAVAVVGLGKTQSTPSKPAIVSSRFIGSLLFENLKKPIEHFSPKGRGQNGEVLTNYGTKKPQPGSKTLREGRTLGGQRPRVPPSRDLRRSIPRRLVALLQVCPPEAGPRPSALAHPTGWPSSGRRGWLIPGAP